MGLSKDRQPIPAPVCRVSWQKDEGTKVRVGSDWGDGTKISKMQPVQSIRSSNFGFMVHNRLYSF